MARKIYAGPTPDGSYVSRQTDNDYSHATVVIDRSERAYKPRDPNADDSGYIANPTLGKWVPISFHGRRDLAEKKLADLRARGYQAAVVPVIEGKPS